MKTTIKYFIVLAFLVSLVAPEFADAKVSSRPSSRPALGILSGELHIGPLCPVAPCNLSEKDLARIYKNYTILVTTTGSSSPTTLIIKTDKWGNFYEKLAPGVYTLDISPNPGTPVCNDIPGVGRICTDGPGSSNVPASIEIKANQKTYLVIEIDTGIR